MAKVAISYGHGVNTFPDTGSKGVIKDGIRYAEHTHNAEVGRRVTKILLEHGVDVLELQPAFGQDIPLKTRTDKANAWKADLYYSIHSNAGNNTGWCGFYWETSAEGKRLAECYAANMKSLGLPMYAGGIYASKVNHWTNFHELRESHMPALLTENGFMTHPEDFKYIFLNKDGSWDKQAVAHAKTILAYFKIAYKEPVVKETPKLYTDKIMIHNTALWQVRPLVKEFKEKGLKAYCWRVVDLPKDVLPQESDAYKFVVETDMKGAGALKLELEKRGYKVEWTSI